MIEHVQGSGASVATLRTGIVVYLWFSWCLASVGGGRDRLEDALSTTAMLQVSHGDDERPSRVTGRDLADGLGRLAQRVGAADDRPDLSGLDQFL